MENEEVIAAIRSAVAKEIADKVKKINLGSVIGPVGESGNDGEDGFSPVISIESVENGTKVTATDKYGEKSFIVMNGTPGEDGQDGRDGAPGTDGKSAYQAAAEKGYTGTEEEFNAALAGMKDAPFLPLSGGTMTGALLVGNPTQGGQAANKEYVDDTAAALIPSAGLPVAKGGTGATTAASARSNLGAAPLASPTFTGTPKAPASSTSYTTYQLRNVALVSAAPSSMNNGAVALVYE